MAWYATNHPPQVGFVLDPNDPTAQQVQAHARSLELEDVQVVRATIVGQRYTYLVLDRLPPDIRAPSAGCSNGTTRQHGTRAAEQK